MSGPAVHLFPYDVRQLGVTFREWAVSQQERWPLAAATPGSEAWVMGPRGDQLSLGGTTFRCHRAAAAGPRHMPWGFDWSGSWQRQVARLDDRPALMHLDGYWSARKTVSLLKVPAVVVQHGRGFNIADLAAADGGLVIRSDTLEAVASAGLAERCRLVTPSCGDVFRPGPDGGDTEKIVGFIGAMNLGKGADLAVAALDSAPDVILEVAGPQYDDALTATLRRHPRVRFLGILNQENVAARMQRWRALWHPSRTEGHSLTLLQAAAVGVPAVVLRGVHPTELARRPNATVVPEAEFVAAACRVAAQSGPRLPSPVVRHDEAREVMSDALERARHLRAGDHRRRIDHPARTRDRMLEWRPARRVALRAPRARAVVRGLRRLG